MASIKKYNGSWRATVKRKGLLTKPLVSHFPTKAEAEEWASDQDRELRRQAKGMSPSVETLNKHTLRSIVERYRDERSKFKGSRKTEVACLNKFLRRTDIVDRTLMSFKKHDAYKYRDLRMQDTYGGVLINYRTVVREFAVLRHIWETAREEWGIPILDNPWSGIKAPPGHKKTKRRKRRLRVGELDRILIACEGCTPMNQILVPFAVHLAIETGMRLQEVMNLKWEDIDFDGRRIEIRKSKTDHKSEIEGRTIVMTIMARFFLLKLQGNAGANDGGLQATDRVFPPTEDGKNRIEAFKQVWKYVLERAHIPGKHHAYVRDGITIEPDGEGLTFHDLRHEAGSRFDSAGLTKGQHDLMMGHSNRDMASLYIHAELSEIQKKLDTYHTPIIQNDPTLEDWRKEFILKKQFELFNSDEEDLPLGAEYDSEEVAVVHQLPSNVIQLFRKRA